MNSTLFILVGRGKVGSFEFVVCPICKGSEAQRVGFAIVGDDGRHRCVPCCKLGCIDVGVVVAASMLGHPRLEGSFQGLGLPLDYGV